MTVAFEIRRPWPQRSSMPATGSRGDGVRWQIRLHHDCGSWCADDPPHRAGAFPWWKPGSYSAFWRLAGRDFYWPAMVTIWHVEPGGRDGLSVCGGWYTGRKGQRRWRRSWRWHVHHWHLQFPPLQHLRRSLLTRCEWCGGRSVKDDQVNFSRSWDHPRSPWWRGERGLYHEDCSDLASAHEACVCTEPAPEHGDHGKCLRCGKFRAWGLTEDRLARLRDLAAVPAGKRRR